MALLIWQIVQWSYHACHQIKLSARTQQYKAQEAKDGLSSLLEGEYNSIIFKSPTDLGRKNLFQMDTLVMGQQFLMQTIPNSIKV